MPVPWIEPGLHDEALGQADVNAPGAGRPLNTDSRATNSMSMNSGSLKPQRFTNAERSASLTVRASVS